MTHASHSTGLDRFRLALAMPGEPYSALVTDPARYADRASAPSIMSMVFWMP